MLELSKIKKGAQARKAINEATVSEYAEHLEAGGSFPPIVVFFDSKDYWLADGWHRLIAHERIGCLTIHEEVRIGSKRDALKYALGANDTHGLRRSNADKRNAIEMALEDTEWSKLSTREVAELCNVSHNLVSEVRRGVTPTGKTENNNTRQKQSAVIGLQPKNNDKNNQHVIEGEVNVYPPTMEPEPPSIEVKKEEVEPEYTALDAAHDQIADLQAQLVSGGLGREDAETYVNGLLAEIKTLKAVNKAITKNRDDLQLECNQLKRQCAMQAKEIKRLKPC